MSDVMPDGSVKDNVASAALTWAVLPEICSVLPLETTAAPPLALAERVAALSPVTSFRLMAAPAAESVTTKLVGRPIKDDRLGCPAMAVMVAGTLMFMLELTTQGYINSTVDQ